MSLKRTIISKENLPPLSPNGEYILRYRIASEDKNRTSHWSPIYTIDAKPLISLISGNVLVNQNVINATWGDTQLRSAFDVFAKFNFDVEHKQLTNNVASITTKDLSSIKVGDTILVSGIDATFDGSHVVTGIISNNKVIQYSKIAADVPYAGANGSVTLGFIYNGTSRIHTYSLLAQSGANSVEMLVQAEGIEKSVSPVLKLYQSPSPISL